MSRGKCDKIGVDTTLFDISQMSYLLHFYIARQIYYPLSLLNGVIEGDFGAAFAGGWGVRFIVVDNTIVALVYHFVITFNISGSA